MACKARFTLSVFQAFSSAYAFGTKSALALLPGAASVGSATENRKPKKHEKRNWSHAYQYL
jgi:hypothetical protein